MNKNCLNCKALFILDACCSLGHRINCDYPYIYPLEECKKPKTKKELDLMLDKYLYKLRYFEPSAEEIEKALDKFRYRQLFLKDKVFTNKKIRDFFYGEKRGIEVVVNRYITIDGTYHWDYSFSELF